MDKFYFYIEWTFKSTPYLSDSCGPFHTRLITDSPELKFDWHRLEKLTVIQFDSEEESTKYWNDKVNTETLSHKDN